MFARQFGMAGSTDRVMTANEPWKTNVKGRFYFEITSQSGIMLPVTQDKNDIFRDPAAPFVFGEIVKRLRVRGYDVSDPRQGKGCFVSRASFPRLALDLMLMIERQNGVAKFRFWGLPRRRLFRNATPSPSDLMDWEAMCDVVQVILEQELKVAALRRMSHHEAFGR